MKAELTVQMTGNQRLYDSYSLPDIRDSPRRYGAWLRAKASRTLAQRCESCFQGQYCYALTVPLPISRKLYGQVQHPLKKVGSLGFVVRGV